MEGMKPEVILECLQRSGATFEGENTAEARQEITKQDFVELGLSGGQGSDQRRKKLRMRLKLPEHMSANALLQAVNLLYRREEFLDLMECSDD